MAVGLITYFGARLPSLDSQRADFNAVLEPLRAEVADLRERVGQLEEKLQKTELKYRIAMRYIEALLELCVPPVPPVPAEIFADL
ncbi:hypothetical protein IU485_28085 [Nocardia cyriacigeorgica]|uniref:hypothetical protein n=1 Tax=Nocardia cyriacigeorgica TaxID=135487 RepID=UPI001892DD68|nr:hypothetical protein [Nocardia cyriacigeorgica]MBF6085233.1 hypothetical protein [Nocardia cyriacigeorgica]